jgi:serine phosphatase RsbU (regulator of sigma subunit)
MRMADGRELAPGRLRKLVRKLDPAASAPELRDTLSAELAALRAERPLDDDQTLVVCRRGTAQGQHEHVPHS